ncbi:MAG: hypothetical protein H6Q00_591 [Holophagaceae bacterium]|nr:hypothetical protein [Holophagaceae bacterium]
MRPIQNRFIVLAFSCVAIGLAATPEPAASKSPSVPAAPGATSPEADITKIEAIPYKPEQQRDPFTVPSDAERGGRGDLVDDIGVKGRVVSGGKVLLVATDSRGNIRTLPVGFRFKDGEIVAISERAVTFHQWEITSTNKSIYRTIVKTFKPEEGKP